MTPDPARALVIGASAGGVQALLAILPELPKGEKDGRPIILPATSWKKEYNTWELPELYAAWPYRLHAVTRPGTAAAVRKASAPPMQ